MKKLSKLLIPIFAITFSLACGSVIAQGSGEDPGGGDPPGGVIPEPATYLLLGSMATLAVIWGRRKVTLFVKNKNN